MKITVFPLNKERETEFYQWECCSHVFQQLNDQSFNTVNFKHACPTCGKISLSINEHRELIGKYKYF